MAARPSIGKGLFDEIVGSPDPVAFLKSLVNSTPPTVENEYRDFKGAANPSTGKAIPDDVVKKTWSEALAGFATAGGGVLIWGIDARKPPNGTVDEALGLNLAPDPFALKSRLQQLQPQATDPPVSGVVIEAFRDPSSNGEGFVVCYVPESEYKPHRAEMASGKRWVMRIGDSFVDVQPSILRSLFFPQRQSYISMHAAARIDTSAQGLESDVMRVIISITFSNEGPATANQFMALDRSTEANGYGKISFWYVNATKVGNQFMYTEPFHPGSIIEMPRRWFDLPRSPGAIDRMKKSGDVDLEFYLYATDQAPQVVQIHFSRKDLKEGKDLNARPTPLPIERFQ